MDILSFVFGAVTAIAVLAVTFFGIGIALYAKKARSGK